MGTDLHKLPLTELTRLLSSKQLSSEELVRDYQSRADRGDSSLKAFLLRDNDGSLAAARAIDARRAKGEELPALAGLPFVLKDNICTSGIRTTCASKILGNYHPPFDATVTSRLKQAGSVLLGKTNLDEFAMGSSTENSAFQCTRNPWDHSRVAGGSSGGSAAAVAAGFASFGLGSDTGGSIRQPASFCGCVGLKPTYGRVSRFGLVAYASSLDQIGPFTRTVEDAATVLQSISGHCTHDSTSSREPVPNWTEMLKSKSPKMKIGVLRDPAIQQMPGDCSSTFEASIEKLRSEGHETIDIELPLLKHAIATYYLVACCEASSNLARYDGAHFGFRAELPKPAAGSNEKQSPLERMYVASRSQGFGAEVKLRILLGTYALSEGYFDAYYLKALKVRRLIRNAFDEAFKKVDVVALPTTPQPAFGVGEKVSDPLLLYLEDIFTVSANLAGLPAISLPSGFSSNGLPIGLQLMAPHFREDRLLQLGHHYQQVTDWHTKLPELS